MLKVLGDVHAGRRFVNDVPLHRRGEREVEVLEQLRKSLDVGPEVEAHVQTGDLFDSFKVDNETVLEVADIYMEAAARYPGCDFYVYPGNHDLAKDESKKSSFQVFDAIVAGTSNIHVTWVPTSFKVGATPYAIMPWHPFKSALELANEVHLLLQVPEDQKFEAVFTHCDTTDYGGPNVLPTQALATIAKSIINGHVHKPSTFTRDGIKVINQGSMQPYAHGEEETPTRYLTLTPEEFEAHKDLHDKYIRVKVPKGAIPPETPDCLGFKILFAEEGKEEAPDVQVEFEEFNTRSLFAQCLKECSVSQETTTKVLEKFDVPQT